MSLVLLVQYPTLTKVTGTDFMARTKFTRKLKETLVFVGEGETEEAFISYLRSLFSTGNPSVKVKSAGGKGPSNVIGDAIGTLNSSGCDRVAALLDLDLPWPKTKVRTARNKKIILIGVDPCIEAMLIDILEIQRPTPCNNQTCKVLLHPKLNGSPTEKTSYAALFNKDMLIKARTRVSPLDDIIKVITGDLK